jgi:hypothetical protein
MKRILLVLLGFLTLGSCVCMLRPVHAQSHDQARREPLRLISYEIAQLELKKPIRLLDREGKEQKYDRAYLVTLKGTFPLNQALAFELFIGDYRIPEYGSTRDGLYFRIYDERVLARLEGKEFRYRFASPEIRGFDMRFSAKGSQPLKIQKEQ